MANSSLISNTVNNISKSGIEKKLADIRSSVHFDAETHCYTNIDDGKIFRSVSEIINAHSEPFDKISTAKHIAKRDAMHWEDVLETWRIKRDYAAVRGTEFHLFAKRFLETQDPNVLATPSFTPIERQIKSFDIFWKRNAKFYEVQAVECMVTDLQSMTAGTVDLLAKHVRTGNYYVFDWKTSEQIRLKNNFHETLLPPLYNVENCELNRYSLQLSIYKALLQKALGISIQKCYFVQFKPSATYEVFEAKDFFVEAANILWNEEMPLKKSSAKKVAVKKNVKK